MLRPYQQRMALEMLNRPVLGLFADMGLGKTLITLKALEQIRGKTLLIAPIRVCETVWRQEAEKWGIDLTFTLVRGTPNERISALQQNTDVYLINPDLLPWLFINDSVVKWNNLIIDESSLFKNPSTVRFKTIKKNLKKFDRRYILTGTPSPNSLMDLWPQIGILDKGQRLGISFGRFRDVYFESDYMGYKWSLRPGSKEKIEEAISDIVLRLDAKDYIELPEMIVTDVKVNLTKKELEQYKKFAEEMILKFGDKELTALLAVTLHGKLSQLANGMVYIGELNEKEIHIFHKQKLNALEELVEEINAPVIIVYNYNHEREEIKKLFPKAVLFTEGDSVQNEKNWNEGKIDQLLLHPKSGSHGLNLQFGGSHIIWFGPTGSLEQYLQMNKRLHRSGQTKPVFIHRLIANETVDLMTVQNLETKDHNQENFLNSMKKLTEKYRKSK